MILGVLLAAGASRRMGRDKLSLPWRGSTVLEATLARWTAVPELDEILLVRRPAAPVPGPAAFAPAASPTPLPMPPQDHAQNEAESERSPLQPSGCPHLSEASRPPLTSAPPMFIQPQARVRVLINPEAEEGMGSSLRIAAREFPAETEAVVVGLADMPEIASATISTLISAWRPLGERGIVAPVNGGRRGHPVVFGAAHVPALRALSGDTGARAILKQCGDNLSLVPVDDPGVLFDLDTPTDLEAHA